MAALRAPMDTQTPALLAAGPPLTWPCVLLSPPPDVEFVVRWAESVVFPALALDVKAEGDAVLDGEALLAGEFGVTGIADAVPDVDMDVVIVGEVVPTVPTLSMAVTVTDGVRVLEGDADAVRVGAGEIHIRNDAVAVLEGCTG